MNKLINNLSNLTSLPKKIFFRPGISIASPSLLPPMLLQHALKTTLQYIVSIILCFIWYFFSSLKSNVTKQILMKVQYPVSTSLLNFVVMLCLCYGAMKFKLFDNCFLKDDYEDVEEKRVKEWGMKRNDILKLVLPISIANVIAQVLNQYSLEFITVSFAHTIKSISPIFTMILSFIFLKKRFSGIMMISIFPIIIGVILSSVNELEFSLVGFITTVVSTLLFSGENIYAKVLLVDKKMDEICYLFYSTLVSLFFLIPFWWISEGYQFIVFLYGQSQLALEIFVLMVLGGIFGFFQSVSSTTFLSSVSPLTYSITTVLKRVFIIVTSILYFGNEVTPLNYLGIMISIGGVLLYNRAKIEKDKNCDIHNIVKMKDIYIV